MIRRLTIAFALLTLLLGACSSTATTTTAAASSDTTAAAAGNPGEVIITLADVSADSMLLTPDPASAAAGEVTFVITNTGTEEHEFVVLKTDLGIADLPFDEAADEVLEDGEGVVALDEIESIMPGETKTLTVTMEAGNYALICNFEGHYRKGMRSAFTVTP
ncbi:MAG: cupredoxin domain-containing protein [Acidimicrobiia bacterium]|nr:cupredoxin domain-containing protein [Acidimicrobiia bacterium]